MVRCVAAMPRRTWVYDPHSGGVKIPAAVQNRSLGETREQHFRRLRDVPTHLCRLRYFGREDAWALAFYTYSNERYEPCVFHNGSFHGTPEEAFDVGAAYLQAEPSAALRWIARKP